MVMATLPTPNSPLPHSSPFIKNHQHVHPSQPLCLPCVPGADPKPHKLLPGSGAGPAVAAPTSHHCCRTPLFRVEEKQQCFCLSRTLFSYKQGNSEGSDSERCVRSSGPGSRQQARPSKTAVKTQQPW